MNRVLLLLLFVAAAALVPWALARESVSLLWTLALPLVAALLWRGRGAPTTEPSRPEDEPPSEVPSWLDAVPCGLLVLDAETRVLAVNRAAARLLGREREEMVGVTLIRATLDHNLLGVAREAEGLPREVELREGEIVSVTATPAGQPGAAGGTILAIEDLTPLRSAQRARSELVANASHELRTPVAAAMALVETLEEGVTDAARQADFHRRLRSEIGRLRDIVEGLLNLSRLESRIEVFEMEALEPLSLLETATARIEPLLLDGQQSRVSAQSVGAVRGDRNRILEVLANLLDNALRVSPPDGEVRLEAIGGADEVRFEVSDEGPGILLHDRERVFERFYTGDAARETGNSGLGLAIARHIVARHGGRIWVSSHTPGTTVCFTLPGMPGDAAS